MGAPDKLQIVGVTVADEEARTDRLSAPNHIPPVSINTKITSATMKYRFIVYFISYSLYTDPIELKFANSLNNHTLVGVQFQPYSCTGQSGRFVGDAGERLVADRGDISYELAEEEGQAKEDVSA